MAAAFAQGLQGVCSLRGDAARLNFHCLPGSGAAQPAAYLPPLVAGCADARWPTAHSLPDAPAQRRCREPAAICTAAARRSHGDAVASSHVGSSDGEAVEEQELVWEDGELDEVWEEEGEVLMMDEEAMAQEERDDLESQAFAVSLAAAANDVKAADIMVLHVSPFVYWTRFMVVATAFSRPQVDAIGKRVRDMALEQHGREVLNTEREAVNSWTILDYGDVVMHIFLPREREFYDIEEFYKEADLVPLPFARRTLE